MGKISLVVHIKDFFITKENDIYKIYLQKRKLKKRKKRKKKTEFEISLELLEDKFRK